MDVKVVILAGGRGTRLSEETETTPKPMVEIGGRPILWHIMKIYGSHGFNEFVILLGYKGEMIKRYFAEHANIAGDLSIDLRTGTIERRSTTELSDWRVHLVETGLETSTGGRVARAAHLLGGETFMLTYGDGVADIDLPTLLAFHRRHGCATTITAVHPPARFGEVLFAGDRVTGFAEKAQTSEGWINGGFMVCEPRIVKLLAGDAAVLEIDGLETLARSGELAAYRHAGFWQCMDTLRDKNQLNLIWNTGHAPWKLWA
jgi:glucose-1-phosphate cytidylyltransferase